MSHHQETQTAVHIGTGIAPLLMLFSVPPFPFPFHCNAPAPG